MNARLVRIEATGGGRLRIRIDGEEASASEGDTLLTAILSHRGHLREAEFGGGRRAGFCLMGACQDCWMWLGATRRVRACTELVEEGMEICSAPPAR